MTSLSPIADPDSLLPSIENPSLFKRSKTHRRKHRQSRHRTDQTPRHNPSCPLHPDSQFPGDVRSPLSTCACHCNLDASQLPHNHQDSHMPLPTELVPKLSDFSSSTSPASSHYDSESSDSDSGDDEIPARLPPPLRTATSKSGNRERTIPYASAFVHNPDKRAGSILDLPHHFYNQIPAHNQATSLEKIAFSTLDANIMPTAHKSLQLTTAHDLKHDPAPTLAKRRLHTTEQSITTPPHSKRPRKKPLSIVHQFRCDSAPPIHDGMSSAHAHAHHQWSNDIDSDQIWPAFTQLSELEHGTPPRRRTTTELAEEAALDDATASQVDVLDESASSPHLGVAPAATQFKRAIDIVEFQLPEVGLLVAAVAEVNMEYAAQPFQLPGDRATWPLWRYLSYLLRKFEKLPGVLDDAHGQTRFLHETRKALDTAYQGVDKCLEKLLNTTAGAEFEVEAQSPGLSRQVAKDLERVIIPVAAMVLQAVFRAARLRVQGVTGDGPVYRMCHDTCSAAGAAAEWLMKLAQALEDWKLMNGGGCTDDENSDDEDDDGFDPVKGFDPKKGVQLSTVAQVVQQKLQDAYEQFTGRGM